MRRPTGKAVCISRQNETATNRSRRVVVAEASNVATGVSVWEGVEGAESVSLHIQDDATRARWTVTIAAAEWEKVAETITNQLAGARSRAKSGR